MILHLQHSTGGRQQGCDAGGERAGRRLDLLLPGVQSDAAAAAGLYRTTTPLQQSSVRPPTLQTRCGCNEHNSLAGLLGGLLDAGAGGHVPHGLRRRAGGPGGGGPQSSEHGALSQAPPDESVAVPGSGDRHDRPGAPRGLGLEDRAQHDDVPSSWLFSSSSASPAPSPPFRHWPETSQAVQLQSAAIALPGADQNLSEPTVRPPRLLQAPPSGKGPACGSKTIQAAPPCLGWCLAG
jgi:hypothetical protein